MNQLVNKLRLDYPIIQAPMAGVSTPEMAASVSNAGALGSIGIGAEGVVGAEKMIRATSALTKRSVNINVFCHKNARVQCELEHAWLTRLAPEFAAFSARPPESLRDLYESFVGNTEMTNLLCTLPPSVVSFHFGLPEKKQIEALKEKNIFLIASATTVDEALLVEKAGCDAVVAQGFEAGGHRGIFDASATDDCVGLIALVKMIIATVKIPVIAAGGIMDGAGIGAAIRLGAAAAQLGTAFILCPESEADEGYRKALQSSAANHTVMTRAISGRPARCLANRFTAVGSNVSADDIPDYPRTYDVAKALHGVAKKSGEYGYGAQWAGQGAPLARALSAGQLIKILAEELAQSNC